MFAREQRQRVVALCVELSRRGYLAGTGGNVALRIDAECFAVTPSAIDYLSMQAEDICIVRTRDLHQLEGARTPSVETGLHAQVMRRRPDVGCSIHTHQPIASACTLLGAPLDVAQPALRRLLGATIPIAGYMPSGTGVLAWLLARQLRPSVNAYLMRNHGVVCCGADLEAAVAVVEALELVARNHLLAQIQARATRDPSAVAGLQRVLSALDSSRHASGASLLSKT
ncbi:class II aldolase/adducin family protein [Xanthomonas maliensis]|uniref:class II aldolase/adducin family protein n=1 Tax=Xanthomonas maliensis TaxID=1321368 RepID=UPI0003A6AEDD|nr:class II aldolase/adducin family protein [Xanthomonas maliensis]KAB7763196.1 aldolase [Xanthomonas maliensis]